MANTRGLLLDSGVRHAVYVQRFAATQTKDAIRYVNKARRAVLDRLAQDDLTTLGKRRYEALLKDLDRELVEIYDSMKNNIGKELQEFGTYEAEFSRKMLSRSSDYSFTAVSNDLVTAAVLSRKMYMVESEMSLNQAFNTFSLRKRKQVLDILTTGVLTGQTNQQLVRQVNEVSRLLMRNQVAALMQTAVTQVSNLARQMVMEKNEDVLEGVEWVSVLDDRTTSTCQALDGQIFTLDSGPRPPLHFNCRSTVIPVVKKEFSIVKDVETERPAVGPDGVESVGGRTNYQSWLARQPKSFQEDVLGVEKTKLFRQGGLTLDKFVDENYAPFTLDELKRKEPEAFKQAGI